MSDVILAIEPIHYTDGVKKRSKCKGHGKLEHNSHEREINNGKLEHNGHEWEIN